MVPKYIWDNFDNIVTETQRRVLDPGFKDMVRSVSSVHAGMELCTVALDPGRGTGKTSYIRNRATAEHLVVVANSAMKHLYRETLTHVFTANELERLGTVSAPLIVFIDEPAQVFRHVPQHELYSKLCSRGHIPLFVLLGRCV